MSANDDDGWSPLGVVVPPTPHSVYVPSNTASTWTSVKLPYLPVGEGGGIGVHGITTSVFQSRVSNLATQLKKMMGGQLMTITLCSSGLIFTPMVTFSEHFDSLEDVKKNALPTPVNKEASLKDQLDFCLKYYTTAVSLYNLFQALGECRIPNTKFVFSMDEYERPRVSFEHGDGGSSNNNEEEALITNRADCGKFFNYVLRRASLYYGNLMALASSTSYGRDRSLTHEQVPSNMSTLSKTCVDILSLPLDDAWVKSGLQSLMMMRMMNPPLSNPLGFVFFHPHMSLIEPTHGMPMNVGAVILPRWMDTFISIQNPMVHSGLFQSASVSYFTYNGERYYQRKNVKELMIASLLEKVATETDERVSPQVVAWGKVRSSHMQESSFFITRDALTLPFIRADQNNPQCVEACATWVNYLEQFGIHASDTHDLNYTWDPTTDRVLFFDFKSWKLGHQPPRL